MWKFLLLNPASFVLPLSTNASITKRLREKFAQQSTPFNVKYQMREAFIETFSFDLLSLNQNP